MFRFGGRTFSKEAFIEPFFLAAAVFAVLGVWWVLPHRSRACGVWVAMVDRRRLVLRVYPGLVTLHCGAGLLVRSPITAAEPEGMLAASLPGSESRLVVRYARSGERVTAALWADDVLVAGTLPGPSVALEELLGAAVDRQAAVAREASARLRAEAEVRGYASGFRSR